MPTLRQLPQLHMRGSIANITMKGLTEDQKAEVEKVFNFIIGQSELTGHIASMAMAQANTIGGDYQSDKEVAKHEAHIAVWKGVVELLFHRSYSFKCANCGATEYRTCQGKVKAFERVYPRCYACGSVRITESGDTDFAPGAYIKLDELQVFLKEFKGAHPKHESPIYYIPGKKKWDKDPQQLLGNPDELRKFFSQFIWGYFAQQINENKRKEVGTGVQKYVGMADDVIREEILSEMRQAKIKHTYSPEINPENGWYRISYYCLQTSPEFTAAMLHIVDKARDMGVTVELPHNEIRVQYVGATDLYETVIVKPEHVKVNENGVSMDGDEDTSFTINQVSYHTIGGQRVETDDPIQSVEYSDALDVVRKSLTEGNCKKVFDIYSNRGQVYSDFVGIYGTGDPKISHIAQFLKVKPKAVKACREEIRLKMMAHNLDPSKR